MRARQALREGDPVVIERGPHADKRGYVVEVHRDAYTVRFGTQRREGEVVLAADDLTPSLTRNGDPMIESETLHQLRDVLLRDGLALVVFASDSDPRCDLHLELVNAAEETVAHAVADTPESVGHALMLLLSEVAGSATIEENRKWSQAYVNDLPDSAFLWIDRAAVDEVEDGRSHPLSTRKLPYKNAQGKVDYAHLKNALARLAVTDMPEGERERVRARAERIFDREFGE